MYTYICIYIYMHIGTPIDLAGPGGREGFANYCESLSICVYMYIYTYTYIKKKRNKQKEY